MRHTHLTKYERQSMALAAVLLVGMADNEEAHFPGIGWYRFNMNRTAVPQIVHGECGTAGCLLGLAHLIECAAGRPTTWKPDGTEFGHKDTPDVNTAHPAYRVFYPDFDGYHDITPRMAGLAAMQFLEGVDEPDYASLEGE